MNNIQEDKWIHYKRVEDIVRNVEENDAKSNEILRKNLESCKTNIGPANELLRYLYVLEQQYQNDNDEIRTKTRENVLGYIQQFQSPDEISDEDNDDEQSESLAITNPQPPMTMPQLPATTSSLSQPPIAASSTLQQSVIAPSTSQQSIATPPPSQLPVATSSASQLPVVTSSSSQLPVATSFLPQTSSSQLPVATSLLPQTSSSTQSNIISLAPVTDPNYIRSDTLVKYEKLLLEAKQYEQRYSTIEFSRKRLLQGRIQEIMNKLREEIFEPLKNELLQFLNRQEQKVGVTIVRISNDEEHLLCLSILATRILSQLLGGDLSDTKTKILLPLIRIISEKPEQKAFRTIFVECLHKRCPYTVPFYPKHQPSMTDDQYKEAMGYIVKQDGNERRLETEIEFLNRMTGLIRLFCKLLVSRGPPFDDNLGFAWQWFADVLNLPPRKNITSLLIRVFLEEAGDKMLETYTKQFPKVIQAIQRQYIPRLETVTSAGEISNLRTILTTFTNKL